jgi:hypothetical protein
MTKKRGQLSLEEEQFIKNNVGILSIDDIASHLNRSINPINRYITENKLISAD